MKNRENQRKRETERKIKIKRGMSVPEKIVMKGY